MARAQNTESVSTSFRHYEFTIASSADYLQVQDTIEDLATRIYTIAQKYPDLNYSTQLDASKQVTSIILKGISDISVAHEASFYLMKLEILGSAVHRMNYAYLPESSLSDKAYKSLNQRQALKFVPEIRESEITYNQMLTRNTGSTIDTAVR